MAHRRFECALQLALIAAMGASLQSCASIRTFQGSAVPHLGHDAGGDGDQLYFELRNMRGFDGGAYAFVLPSDWASRPTTVSADGTLKLASPLDGTLTSGEHLVPQVSLQNGANSATTLRPEENIPLMVLMLDPVTPLEAFDDQVRRRLDVGANAYALVRPVDTSTWLDADLFGARFAPPLAAGPAHAGPLRVDPPSFDPAAAAAPTPVEWVYLTHFHFEDSRGALAKVGDFTLRRVPDGVLMATVVVGLLGIGTLPAWIWFV